MKTAFAIVALGVLACTTSTTGSGGNAGLLQQARAAIKALEERDRDAVEACEADVRACFASLADAGASDACEDLREQCREAKESLEGVRKPAVECWRQVEECVEQGKPVDTSDAGAAADAGESCSVGPRDCAALGDDVDEDRTPILECKREVRECLSSVRQRAEDWREECGDVREACSDICGLAVRASHERGRRGGRPEGLRSRVRQLLAGMHERRHGGHRSPGHGGADDRADAGRR